MYNNQIPNEYRPLGMWAYFGYTLLFSVPIAGFICILVFSFGGASNINLRNFARSYLCWYIIALVLAVIGFIIILLIALITGVGLSGMFPSSSAFKCISDILPLVF